MNLGIALKDTMLDGFRIHCVLPWEDNLVANKQLVMVFLASYKWTTC